MGNAKISVVVYFSGGASLIVAGILIIYALSLFLGLGCILLGSFMITHEYEFSKYLAFGGAGCLVLGGILLGLQRLLS